MQNGFSQLRLLIKRTRWLSGGGGRRNASGCLGSSRLMQMMVDFQARSKESVAAEDLLPDKTASVLTSEQRRGVI